MKSKLRIGDHIRIIKLPGTLKGHKYFLPSHLEKVFKDLVKRKVHLEVNDVCDDNVWLSCLTKPEYEALNIDINENIWRKVKCQKT